MSLDFPYTCQNIDQSITNITEHIQDFGETLKELDDLDEYYYYYESKCLNYVISEIENLRYLNSALRDAADKQISDLRSRMEELEEDNSRLGNEIDNLNYILEELEK